MFQNWMDGTTDTLLCIAECNTCGLNYCICCKSESGSKLSKIKIVQKELKRHLVLRCWPAKYISYGCSFAVSINIFQGLVVVEEWKRPPDRRILIKTPNTMPVYDDWKVNFNQPGTDHAWDFRLQLRSRWSAKPILYSAPVFHQPCDRPCAGILH